MTLQDLEQARAFYEKGYWRDETIYMLLRQWAAKTPDRHALRDANSRLTYKALLEWVDALGADLHAGGLREGDRVSIWLPSRAESAIILLACSRMGYVCNTSLHRDYTCKEIINLLERAGSKAFFYQPGYGADADRNDIELMLKSLPQIKKIYQVPPLIEDAAEGDPAERFGGLSLGGRVTLPFRTNPDRPVYLAFTSGTTGLPKGVMHSDNTILANVRAIVKDWSFDQSLTTYTPSPMSHNIGTVGLSITLVAGGEFVVHTPLDAKRTLDRILQTGATFLLGVPTHAIDLLTAARQRNLPRLGKVFAFQLGGAPVPPAVVAGLMELGVSPQNCFGMTENCSFQYTRPGDPTEVVMNTCGRPCDGFEIKLWRQDSPDEEVRVGEVGELGCRGACLMLGYFADQNETEGSFNSDGWFMTGDLGRLDEHGNLQIAGRKKDLIIRGGHNIHPAKIEDLTLRHPAVVKAAAFPVPDQRLGERVCLAIIASGKEGVTGREILRHLEDLGLSKYDLPEWYLELESFPLTPSGKVLKRRLAELVREGALSPQPLRGDVAPPGNPS
ncbi:MAG: class I adenylate-forming enzyme family protein [Xanthobacteraceae bacterium]